MITDKIPDNKFTGFIQPVLNLIDNGVIYRKGFWLLYLISAGAALLVPVLMMVGFISNGLFRAPVGVVVGIVFVWLALAFACWLGFQVFWNRMKKIDTLFKEGEDFIAMPLVADYIKTLGEYYCLFLIGCIPGLVLLGIFAMFSDTLKYFIPLAALGIGLVFASIGIGILGYLIMLLAKFFAESLAAFAAIANNTKSLKKD
jgi:hypothetical protein